MKFVSINRVRLISDSVCELHFYFSFVKSDVTIRHPCQMPGEKYGMCSEEREV